VSEIPSIPSDSKPCPVCGETIKAAALKCRFCNTDLAAYESAKQAEVEHEVWSGHPAAVYSAWQWILVVITLGIAYLVLWIKSRSITFRITTQRVQVERGLFSTIKDNIELFTIEHFDVHKPLGMRIAGHSLLHLRSADDHATSLMLYGIPNLDELADQMRENSLRERTRRRVTTFIET
jgi:uncharacterized membrane protein YdbT with pleckstrin-like domain